jgi:starch phosphorylase
MQRGDKVTVFASVHLGPLSPEEVCVELYYGKVSPSGTIEESQKAEMKAVSQQENFYRYEVQIECTATGRQGHTVRILPKHKNLVHPYLPGLIKWA